MATVNDLKGLLASRTGFETLDEQVGPSKLRLVGRVPLNANSQWVLVIHRLLLVSERTPWKVDVSRFYFIRTVGNNQKLFYTWRLIFDAPQITNHIKSIMDAVHSAPRPSRVELQEIPLHGAQRNHQNGKGAYAAETTPMVAHVAAMARMGGIRS